MKEKLDSSVSTPKKSARNFKAHFTATVSPEKGSSSSDAPPIITSISNNFPSGIDDRVQTVYKVVRAATGALGGNGYNGAIYGELTMHSMHRILNILIDSCEMNESSRFIDVGSGLGKPNFHAAQHPGVRLSLGIELEEIRWQLAMHNFNKLFPYINTSDNDTAIKGNTNFIVGDIDRAMSMDPFTHVYMYDLGFPPPLQQSIAEKFNNSQHSRYLVSYRPPRRVIEEYGYEVELIEQVITSMHGSGENHTAYFYKRTNQAPLIATQGQMVLKIPATPTAFTTGSSNETVGKEVEEEVYCDDLFYEASVLAMGDLDKLAEHVREKASEFIDGKRSVRSRTPRVIHDT